MSATDISLWICAVLLVLVGLGGVVLPALPGIPMIVGAKRVGASTLALVGAAVGTVVGLFAGLIGLLFAPLAGAAIGEYIARRDARQAARVGVATWIGMLLAAVAKVAIAFMMLGIALATFFF